MKNKISGVLLLLCCLVAVGLSLGGCKDKAKSDPEIAASHDTVAGQCVTCHKEKHPGIYNQWLNSPHGQQGVSCLGCHNADPGDSDAFEHHGATVATLVTPKDCSSCHKKEADEVGRSHHATAGKILQSNDAYLAHAVGGSPVAQMGCEGCHGAVMKIDENAPNKLDASTWPNSGIGRVNPDGSQGSCTACHTRHSFSKAQARSPDACSKCHVGPDHPQKEVYEASKHGQAFFTQEEKMNLHADRWIVGVDYSEAPTCATCHMSATQKQPVTHDVGQRISWTLRPPVSKTLENWQERRDNMKDVCAACHSSTQVDGHYRVFDGVVNLYNEKFAKPAVKIMEIVKKKKLLENKAAFSNDLEWYYWELWHHEGRRARHGAAMMSPDFTWWKGIYEVAKNFYFKFLPEAQKLNDPDVNAVIEEIWKDPKHAWFNRETKDIKKDIQSGELQKIYADMFTPEYQSGPKDAPKKAK